MYRAGGISNSPEFQALLRNPTVDAYLRRILSRTEYNNPIEGFAELFTYYHSCDISRNQMQQQSPELYEFFRNLTTSVPYR